MAVLLTWEVRGRRPVLETHLPQFSVNHSQGVLRSLWPVIQECQLRSIPELAEQASFPLFKCASHWLPNRCVC